MKRALILSLAMCSISLGSGPAHPPATAHDPPRHGAPAAEPAGLQDAPAQALSRADEAMQKLLDGNDRFRYDESTFPRLGAARRNETFTDGQKPFAAILGCADSRMPIEAIFDQGVGDLFVVRVAGNVADTDEIGTLEYGVGHLNIPLVVVLGHTKCGAVTAVAEGAKVHGHIGKLVDNIAPAVELVKDRDPDARGPRLVRLATRANVMQSIHDILAKSPDIAAAVKAGKVRVIGGVYDIQTGGVEWLGPHPRQAELISAVKAVEEKAVEDHADDHAAPHAGHGAAHDESTDAHDAHDAHAKPTTRPAKAAAQQENWIALGGLLGASTLASGAAIHFLYGRAS